MGIVTFIGIGFMLLLIMIIGLFPIIALISALKTDFQGENDKLIWVLVILFLPIMGSILYFALRRPRAKNN